MPAKRGVKFAPEIEVSLTVRRVPVEYAPDVSRILAGATEEVNDLARLTNPTAASIEAAIEIAQHQPTLSEQKDAIMAEALRRTGGNIRAAAALVSVSERTFYRWVQAKGKDTVQGTLEQPALTEDGQ